MKYIINSYEVSVATGMSHRNLKRKIRGSKKDIGIIQRIEHLGGNVEDYLKLTRYADGNGKFGECYIFTELGYNFLLILLLVIEVAGCLNITQRKQLEQKTSKPGRGV